MFATKRQPINKGNLTTHVQPNLVNTTRVCMTRSILRHIFARPNILVQNPLFYMTMTLDNMTFIRISISSC